MEDDFLLDDDDVLDDEGLMYGPLNENDDDDDDESESGGFVDEDEEPKVKVESYEGRMTEREMWLSNSYDDIIAAGKKSADTSIIDAATTIVMANPNHTASMTVGRIIQEMFQKQGHNRLVNSIYTPDTPLTGEDVDIDFLGEDDSGFNKTFANEAREQIARFIDFLANRDLSKDDIYSRRRKQRQIPAFLIFLFSSGLYDLVVNCPTLPEEYQKQVTRAMKHITDSKYDVVEQLARRYEEVGRPAVAQRVRKLQFTWFEKEPAEIRTTSYLADLELTYDDVLVYREYRSKFTNISKSITQDVISDLIEVVEEDGIYTKLKDKTRSEAIADVKQVYKNWSKDNSDSELASRIIWKDIDD